MCTVQSTGASMNYCWSLKVLYLALQCATLGESEPRPESSSVPSPVPSQSPQSPPGAIGHWSHSALSPGSHKDNYLRSQSLVMTRAECQGGEWQRSRQQWRLVQNVKRRGCTVTIHALRNFLNYSQQWHFQSQSHPQDSRQDLKWWDLSNDI